MANDQSCQPCGCDPGASYVCSQHMYLPGKFPSPQEINDGYYQPGPYSDKSVGIGGAPTRPTTIPTTAAERKQYPIATGFMDYFPDAIVALAHLSWVGNQQHNPGKPLHWDRSKSADEADTTLRHFMERGTLDKDGVRHSVKFAWRALALLQKEIENER